MRLMKMVQKLRELSLHFTILFILIKVTSPSVTITSSSGTDVICNNETVTLTCHTTDGQTNNITWYWSGQSKRGSSITVLATPHKIVYTCVASEDNGTSHKANITIVANGAPPRILKGNFYNYVYVYEGSDYTLFTNITSKPLLSKVSVNWYGYNRDLPTSAEVLTSTVHGITYSTLKLYNLSFFEDSGLYINSASNKCGKSTASVFIAVRTSPRYCFNNGVPSLATSPNDYTTVVGEYASFTCRFDGSIPIYNSPGPLSSYWAINYGSASTSSKPIIVYRNSTNYHIAVYDTCSNNEYPCCQFITKLMVYNATSILNGATVNCYEYLQRTHQSNAIQSSDLDYATAKAILSVYIIPELISGPKDVTAGLSQNVKFVCNFKASTEPGVSIVVWLRDDFDMIQSSSHYNISRSIKEDPDHFTSTLTILSITSEDEGKYTCYCYYNKTLVTSTKNEYVRSIPQSANLHIKDSSDDSKSWSGVQLYAFISAGTAVFVSVLTIWIIGITYYLRHRRRPHGQLVNLPSKYGSDDEEQPLINKTLKGDREHGRSTGAFMDSSQETDDSNNSCK